MVIPSNDLDSGLQRIKDNPDEKEQVRRLTQYLDVGDRRMKEARRYRLELIQSMKAGGATWRELSTLSGLSEQYLRGEVK